MHRPANAGTSTQPVKAVYVNKQNRVWRVWRFIGESQLRTLSFNFEKQTKPALPSTYGAWLRNELIELGPAFIKLGQFLSTRSDVFGKEAVAELSKLQDSIPEIPVTDIYSVIDGELGRPWQEVFESIESKSLASASIGQVHLARLRGGDESAQVVIKVQKPNVQDMIEHDLKTLGDVVRILSFFQPQRGNEFKSILQQYETFLSSELDFVKEAGYMDLMKKEFEGFRGVYIPKAYRSLSTKRVLVMEYVPSIKINDIKAMQLANITTSRVATNLAQTFLYMIVYIGVVHCDPHPGNLGLLNDGETIVLYDFGNVVSLGDEFNKYIFQLVFAVAQKDVDEFVELLLKLRIVEMKEEIDLIELKAFFVYFFDYLDSLDFESLRQSIVNNESIANAQLSLRIDQNFLSLFRVFSLLDGTCLELDPDFSYIQALQPFSDEVIRNPSFVGNRMMKDVSKLGTYPRLLKNTEVNLMKLDKRVKGMSNDNHFAYVTLLVIVLVDNCVDSGNTTMRVAFTAIGIMMAFIWSKLKK